jgi:hypothetical protein
VISGLIQYLCGISVLDLKKIYFCWISHFSDLKKDDIQQVGRQSISLKMV